MILTENDIEIRYGEAYEEIVLPEGNEPWVGGINSVFYRISRGKPVRVPANLAALIRQNERCRVISSEIMTEYTKGDGKKLRGGRK